MQPHVTLELLHTDEAGSAVFKAADAYVVLVVVLLLHVCEEVGIQ